MTSNEKLPTRTVSKPDDVEDWLINCNALEFQNEIKKLGLV